MASNAKSSNNTGSRQKTHWCIPALCCSLNQQGYHITGGVNPCRFGSKCFNAHDEKDIEKKPLISMWERIKDFSHFDLGAMMDNILTVMDSSRENVHNPKYRSGVVNVHSLSFIDLLAFWYDISCHHRRIAKELPSKWKWHDKSQPMPIEEYHYQEDVPKFALTNEDNVWALERVLHMCPTHSKLCKTRQHNMKEVCGGSFNCKYGVHNLNDLVCVDNLLTGECKCASQEDIEMTQTQIREDIMKLNTMLESSVDADGFKIKMSRKVVDGIRGEIREKNHELMSVKPRIRHLTEQGLIPLKVHLDKKKEIAMKVEAAVEEIVMTKKILKKKYC